jgi:hypothetical protein
VRKPRESSNQPITVYLPDRAVGGFVERFLETGVDARMDSELPRCEWFRFLLQLQGGVISGDLMCVRQAERACRLQFSSLTPGEQARLAPLIEPD